MLQSLSVKNFILIDELEIEFEKGLCVITGETGAGKSVLLDAILFSLGSKFSDNVIKHGGDYCSVATTFTLNDDLKKLLKQFNIEYDQELLIKRIQKSNNRKKFLINDQVVTVNTLQQVADCLFELHGQNSHTSLLSPSSHINILDDYGELLNLRAELSEHFDILQTTTKEINKVTRDKDTIEQEIDYLTFVTKELKTLDYQSGEEEKLVTVRRSLQNRDKEIQVTQDILSHLEFPEINKSINNAQRLINRSLRQNEEFSSISLNLDDCYNSLEEARIKLQSIINNFDKNEFNLDEVEERLFKIRDIARKYNISCEKIPVFFDNSNQQLNALKSKINNVKTLDINKRAEYKKYFELAEALSYKRSISAKNLELAVQKELEQLKMEKAVFKIEILPKNNPDNQDNNKNFVELNMSEEFSEEIKQNPESRSSFPYNSKVNSDNQISSQLLLYKMYDGIDNVRFVASTNPGTKLAPIDKIASGGELSRFMLALKTCLFDKSLKDTIIFDEIDTGTGGIVADKVGEKLKKLSSIAQVLVITHQPQVAGKADQHIIVNKLQLDETTKITVKSLNLQERQTELARMISGESITDASLKAAKELLKP
ncbi:DNA repair protein RecN [Candidatus Tisiphia endosymbiont of Oplodontha viridula]|uniref:DNA repair protein RecN n=1 Tax=Candidatus Tisiphia endosymbiont of Oplodontha viridula TaxID=3077925 RepID=UPI0035C8B2DE